MRAFCFALYLMAAASFAAAQDKPAAAQKNAPTPTTLTLTGCVEKGSTPNQFTLADTENGKYQVRGNRIGRYLGQRVEIAGVRDTSKLAVKGGLWPSPNVAGQAGAIDPTKAAVAAQPGGPSSGTGDVNLPTLRVKSVKTVTGGCR